jgi:hypothetical protein
LRYFSVCFVIIILCLLSETRYKRYVLSFKTIVFKTILAAQQRIPSFIIILLYYDTSDVYYCASHCVTRKYECVSFTCINREVCDRTRARAYGIVLISFIYATYVGPYVRRAFRRIRFQTTRLTCSHDIQCASIGIYEDTWKDRKTHNSKRYPHYTHTRERENASACVKTLVILKFY